MIRKLRSQFSSFKFQKDLEIRRVISELPSGIKVVTEQTAFPFHSDIGICFKAGIRDERLTEKGALHALNAHMYYTNQDDCLVNFENTMRTGCMLEQLFDQEFLYWKCSFIQEDFDNILDVLLRLSLTEKTISSEMREQYDEYQIMKARLSQQQKVPVEEICRKAAFYQQLAGNSKHESQELPKQADFQRFQQELLTPENMIIAYSGIWTHDQFREQVEKRLAQFQEFFFRKERKRLIAKFVSNTYREVVQNSQDLDIALLFEGTNWSHEDMATLHVLSQILGSSSSWSSGGPGKGMRSRTTLNLMQRVASVEEAGAVNIRMTDAGAFGIRVTGSSQSGSELYESMIAEFKGLLAPMSDEEFIRGKNIANTLIQINLERQADRLEETVKSVFQQGEMAAHLYEEKINAVTKEKLQSKVKELIASEPTIMYHGTGFENLPDVQMTKKRLRK